MADPAPTPVQIPMPLDDDLIAAVQKGVQLERVLAIQALRNSKATLDALNALLAVQKLPSGAATGGATLLDAVKALQALQPQPAPAPASAVIAITKV